MLRKSALVLLALLAALIAAVAANTLRQGSRQIAVPPAPPLAVDEQAAARRLAAAVRLRTVSADDEAGTAASAAEFRKLHALLAQAYPRAHAALQRETVNQLSLLYAWPGSDPAAKPLMLMAHQDVVPIAPGTEKDWLADPFGGEIRDGFVWGRGTWDDKGNLLAIFEAVEMLLAEGFQPRQTIYIASGHDEEAGGQAGAKAIAELLRARGVRLDFVLDEGLLVTEGVLKGLDAPLALIGIAEKGYLTVALEARTAPGHASMPPPRTAIGTLAGALARLEARPMPAAIDGVAAEMFDTIAPEMDLVNRVLLSNRWLFGPLIRAQLEKGASSNAMLRSGNKENVLPGVATAQVNFRILPGDSIDGVLAHARAAIGDETVTLAPDRRKANEATAASPPSSPSYRLVARTVRELFPGTLVAPGLMIAATDSRHMAPLADAIYRFSPVRTKAEDLARFHGSNERIALANHADLIRFYHRLLMNAAKGETP